MFFGKYVEMQPKQDLPKRAMCDKINFENSRTNVYHHRELPLPVARDGRMSTTQYRQVCDTQE